MVHGNWSNVLIPIKEKRRTQSDTKTVTPSILKLHSCTPFLFILIALNWNYLVNTSKCSIFLCLHLISALVLLDFWNLSVYILPMIDWLVFWYWYTEFWKECVCYVFQKQYDDLLNMKRSFITLTIYIAPLALLFLEINLIFDDFP